MAETLKPFLHKGNDESYLFGFEDYLSKKELNDLWTNAMYSLKHEVSALYGDIWPFDVVTFVSNAIGLRMPKKRSQLWQEVTSIERAMINHEEEHREQTLELGYDTDDEFDEEAFQNMQQMMRSK